MTRWTAADGGLHVPALLLYDILQSGSSTGVRFDIGRNRMSGEQQCRMVRTHAAAMGDLNSL